MKVSRYFLLVLLVVAASAAVFAGVPKTLILNSDALERLKKERSNPAVVALVKQADKLLKKNEVFSVLNKSQTPPSGDKHDYMSQAPYWWPDPSKPNGLPYIRRDGERNPELNKITDHDQLDQMLEDSETLAIAWYLTGEEKYAVHAGSILRTWFLDPKTRQNPNLNFAQGIPGINKGRGIGLIETRHMYRAIDASILLGGSKSWTQADQANLKKWFAQFLDWVVKSPLGIDESDERNNHGTHYDVQVVAYAVFTGQDALARKQLEITKGRIKSQIEPDGSQPHELARTLSWNYSNMNLLGFFTLARLGESVSIDLWNYETSDKRGIRRAVEWLVPFVGNDQAKWTHQQIKPRTFELTSQLLNIAAIKYKKPNYTALAKAVDSNKNTTTGLSLY